LKKLIALLAVLLIAAIVAVILLPTTPAHQKDTPKDTVQTPPSSEETPGDDQPVIPAWMTFPEDRVLTAKQAFVYDLQSQKFLFLDGSETDKVYPASITKLFTAYVALQILDPETVITAGDALDLVGYGSSVAEIAKGDELTVETLVQAMLLPSGNDASYILAAEAGRTITQNPSLSASQAVAQFMKEVNGMARILGLRGTHFTNPDGYHAYDHYTCVGDLVTIAKLAMDNSTIAKYAVTTSAEVTFASGTKQWHNTNFLIDPASDYYCAYATGLKTGQTPAAGSCLLSSFDVDGSRYVIGVFGCPEIEDRFADTLQLFNEYAWILHETA